MWCPKCKNEYIKGVMRCADCGTALVEPLHDNGSALTREPDASIQDQSTAYQNTETKIPGTQEKVSASESIDSDLQMDIDETGFQVSKGGSSHAYVSKWAKREDLKSTAYSFTIVSLIGVVFLILFASGVIPLNTAGYMKIMICIVMGGMFLIFLGIGLKSFTQLKNLGEAADSEEKSFKEITAWFHSACTKEEIDSSIDTNQGSEQLYFCRYEIMNRIIQEKYPNLDEAFLDHIIESLYTELF